MNKATVSAGGNGIGLLGAVFLIFLILKLTGHIDWSWWWVTAPLWGTTALVVLVIVLALGVGLLTGWLRQRRQRRRGTLR